MAISRNIYKGERHSGILKAALSEASVSLFIHCAANTNVEQCEEFPDKCYQDNYLWPELLASLCDSLGIKFVFISSTGIYGLGKKTAYDDMDEVNPTTVHHRSKWLAEQAVDRGMSDYLIIRTGWLFGGPWDSPNNFVANRIREAQEEPEFIKSDSSQFGCPTYVDDVTVSIFKLLSLGAKGTFNCVNEGYASRFEYVSKILELANLPIKITAVDGKSFNRKAKVSWNEMADNNKLKVLTDHVMPDWQKSLELYLSLHRNRWS